MSRCGSSRSYRSPSTPRRCRWRLAMARRSSAEWRTSHTPQWSAWRKHPHACPTRRVHFASGLPCPRYFPQYSLWSRYLWHPHLDSASHPLHCSPCPYTSPDVPVTFDLAMMPLTASGIGVAVRRENRRPQQRPAHSATAPDRPLRWGSGVCGRASPFR